VNLFQFYLKKFQFSCDNLETLQLDLLNDCSIHFTMGPHDASSIEESLSHILLTSQRTLKHLAVFGTSLICNILAHIILPTPCENGKQLKVHLKLMTLELSLPEPIRLYTTELEQLVKLYTSQKDLKGASYYPWHALAHGPNDSSRHQIEESFPTSLTLLRSNFEAFPGSNFIRPRGLSKFTALEDLSITLPSRAAGFQEFLESIGDTICHRMKRLQLDINFAPRITSAGLERFGKQFQHITVLRIDSELGTLLSVDDSFFQIIIGSFLGLEDLQLGRCPGLTDVGITGIPKRVSDALLASRSIEDAQRSMISNFEKKSIRALHGQS